MWQTKSSFWELCYLCLKCLTFVNWLFAFFSQKLIENSCKCSQKNIRIALHVQSFFISLNALALLIHENWNVLPLVALLIGMMLWVFTMFAMFLKMLPILHVIFLQQRNWLYQTLGSSGFWLGLKQRRSKILRI